MDFISKLGKDLVSLVYPKQCIGCNSQKGENTNIYCITCNSKIGYTDHFEIKNNELIKRISPRINPQHGAALFEYIKEGLVQKAIHGLKYSGRFDLGNNLGKTFGRSYILSPHFSKADYIIPIPIHNSKRRKRGYNQSYEFAKGIFDVTDIPILEKVLVKKAKTTTQTKKGRTDRFDQVLGSFSLQSPEVLKGMTILIVDDVLTTGATIEAAYTLLNEIENITIQLGLIAIANN